MALIQFSHCTFQGVNYNGTYQTAQRCIWLVWAFIICRGVEIVKFSTCPGQVKSQNVLVHIKFYLSERTN